MISDRLRIAVKLSSTKQYQFAQAINVHPSLVSGWLNRIYPVKPGDPRVIALGSMVGLTPEECFTDQSEFAGATR